MTTKTEKKIGIWHRVKGYGCDEGSGEGGKGETK
jgi:hypothetical protein